jgi:ABC-type transport system substrate-binding protein
MKRDKLTICVISLLLVGVIPLSVFANSNTTNSIKNGLFIDKIMFHHLNGEEAIQALLDDEIQLIGDMIDPTLMPELEQSEGIEISETLRNGYGYITINCRKYPFNITAFRRALAFAIDKEAICEDVWNGKAEPLDSLVPKINPFSIEEDLTYHYYSANVTKGNELLDAAGFNDIDEDEYREAPNGDSFDVIVEVAESSDIALGVGSIVEEALQSLGINGTSKPTDFYEYLNKLYFHHQDYDIAFMGESFSDFTVDWLADIPWPQYAGDSCHFPHFTNASYDSWKDQLLHNTTLEGVKEAAREMQEVWVYQSPEIICYETYEYSAYRNDRFVGFVNQVDRGVSSFWTSLQTHLREEQGGPYGGTLHRSFPLDVGTFNVFQQHCYGVEQYYELLYDSLLREGPDGYFIPWLAESYSIETHEDNEEVQPGYTRFTFNLVQNATWTDGSPLTAEDVSFSFNFFRDTAGNRFRYGLEEMKAAFAKTTNTFVIEFNTTSYWHLHNIGTKPIIPKQVYNQLDPGEWNSYNLSPPEDEMITSGPYNVSDRLYDHYTEFSRNPNYFYQYNDGISTPQTTPPQFIVINPLAVGVLVTAVAGIVGGSAMWIREIRSMRQY